MEIGRDHHGLHHKVTADCARGGFDMGHHGYIDQEYTFYSYSREYFCGEVGIYLYMGGFCTSWGPSVSDFRLGGSFHYQILEEVLREVGYSITFQYDLPPTD